MIDHPFSILDDHRITRRHFMQIMSLSAAALATGCAIDPVTGKQQLMLVSEDQEIQIDKQYAPMQFSADYGLTQDKALDNYDQRLPGNPNIVFFKGYCQENMQNNKAAANYYHQYLQVVNQGKYAQHAYQRMQQWGYY